MVCWRQGALELHFRTVQGLGRNCGSFLALCFDLADKDRLASEGENLIIAMAAVNLLVKRD